MRELLKAALLTDSKSNIALRLVTKHAVAEGNLEQDMLNVLLASAGDKPADQTAWFALAMHTTRSTTTPTCCPFPTITPMAQRCSYCPPS